MRCFFSVLNKPDLFISPLRLKNSSLGQLSLLHFITRWMVSFALRKPLISTLNRLRGPFSKVSDYPSSWVKAELCVISRNPSTALLELGGNRESSNWVSEFSRN